MVGEHSENMKPASIQQTPRVARPARTVDHALAHAPAGLLVTGAVLFAAVAALAVVLLRAH